MDRHAGVLLHPTSLPGPFGIGDLGPAASRWIDFLSYSGCSLWQVLPLGPTGYADSPYQCFSAFAGNPYLISPEALLADGMLTEADLVHDGFPTDHVDYGAVIPWKLDLLDVAHRAVFDGEAGRYQPDYRAFRVRHRRWLDDYALFMALKDTYQARPWSQWHAEHRDRRPRALDDARHDLAETIDRHAFRQWLFFRQWQVIRERAHHRGIRIIGDIPIFVAHDSADVWANRQLFSLDEEGRPTVVAGVPPDYFSETGQLWGNPLYRWSVHRKGGYAWWIDRVRSTLEMVDIVRLDHFRGFHDYWEIPAGRTDAVVGRWRKGPGAGLFRAIERELGELPLIAEDLGGDLGEGVHRLRDKLALPGMKVLLFAFAAGPDNEFLPHNYTHPNWVVYTGTHDNDTALGWYESAPEHERHYAREYLGTDGSEFSWDLIRLGWSCIARYALAPMQDVLGLGAESRMNRPGTMSGNWMWRMSEEDASPDVATRLRAVTGVYGRLVE